MTNLTEMVEWLRSQIETDRHWAQQVIALSEEWDSWRWDKKMIWSLGGTQMAEARSPIIAAHIATHDPRDTIARCEAELGIIDDYEQARRKLESGPDPCAPGSVFLSGRHDALRGAITRLGYGYRHRDGYKASWTT